MNRILAVLFAVIAMPATAAVSLVESTAITLLRGSTTVGTFSTWEACRVEALRLANVDTRTSGTVTYTCQTEKRRVVATYSANPPPPPACGPQPPTETQTVNCPAGSTGTGHRLAVTLLFRRLPAGLQELGFPFLRLQARAPPCLHRRLRLGPSRRSF